MRAEYIIIILVCLVIAIAITRAKRKLILLGEPQAFIYSVNNASEYVRKSYLLERIREALYNK